jgi:uncharacterized protein
MAVELPDLIEPWRLAEQRTELAGCIGADRLKRITAPYWLKGPVQVVLELADDGRGNVRIRGTVSAELGADCQRCLRPMRLPITQPVDVVLTIGDDETATDERDKEVIVLPADRMSLWQYVEDEIILACPVAPMHETHECRAMTDGATAESEKIRPFAGLAELLNREDTETD